MRWSEEFRRPVMLKPWQGGPPETRLIDCPLTNGVARIESWNLSAVISVMSTSRNGTSGWFSLWAVEKSRSMSVAISTSKPAFFSPSVMPPAPENRSTAYRCPSNQAHPRNAGPLPGT